MEGMVMAGDGGRWREWWGWETVGNLFHARQTTERAREREREREREGEREPPLAREGAASKHSREEGALRLPLVRVSAPFKIVGQRHIHEARLQMWWINKQTKYAYRDRLYSKALRPVPPIRTLALMLLLKLQFKLKLHVKLKLCFLSNIVSSDSPSALIPTNIQTQPTLTPTCLKTQPQKNTGVSCNHFTCFTFFLWTHSWYVSNLKDAFNYLRAHVPGRVL